MNPSTRFLWIGGRLTELHDLEATFEGVQRSGPEDPEQLRLEIVRRVRASNYVSPASEHMYADALWKAYCAYCGEPATKGHKALAIRIVGPGCKRCEELARRIRAVCADLEVTVDIQHVSGYRGLPAPAAPPSCALVINGAVRTLPDLPSIAALHELLGARIGPDSEL